MEHYSRECTESMSNLIASFITKSFHSTHNPYSKQILYVCTVQVSRIVTNAGLHYTYIRKHYNTAKTLTSNTVCTYMQITVAMVMQHQIVTN